MTNVKLIAGYKSGLYLFDRHIMNTAEAIISRVFNEEAIRKALNRYAF
jgi:hypothetical protein